MEGGIRQRQREEKPKEDQAKEKKAPLPQKVKKGRSCFSIFLVLLLIVAGIFGYLFLIQKFRLRELKGVKRIDAEFTDEMKGEMILKREPRLIPNAVPKGTLLSVSSFQSSPRLSQIPLSKVQKSSSGIFAPFDSSSPLVEASYLETTGSFDDLLPPFEAGQFWSEAASENGVFYLYDAPTYLDFKEYSHDLPEGLPLAKQATLSARFLFATKGSFLKPSVHITNTYFSVLDGGVEVILFPPSETHHLYPYPEYHPNAGSGQVLFREDFPFSERLDILLRYPDLLKVKGRKVFVPAGDILYIPAFWYAQVSFSNASVILKTFSSAYESEVLHELLHLDVPHTDNLESEIFIVKKLLDWTIPASLNLSADQFIRSLVVSRYLPLYQRLSIETSTDFSACHQEDPETEGVVKEFSEKHLENIRRLSKALKELKYVRMVAFEHYVEHLVQKTISAEDAYNFYSLCFDVGVGNARSSALDIE